MTHARTNQNTVSPEREIKSVNLTRMVQLLSSASDALFAQANLHRQLAKIEWKEEKERLSHMFTALLVGISCFICLLIFLGVLVITLTWNTDYQSLSLVLLCIVYGLATYFFWKRFTREAKRPERFFVGTREEIAADLAMIRSKL